MNPIVRLLYLLPFLYLMSACTGIKNSQYYEYLSTSVEEPECLTSYNYATSVSVTGTAKFFKRGVVPITQYNNTLGANELKNLTLGDPLAAALPIRLAEVIVYNSTNQIVQCGVTDASGNLKALDGAGDLKIPKTAGNYIVQVLARINTDFVVASKPTTTLHVSIKKDKYTNKVHKLISTSYSNGIDGIGLELIAYARQTDDIEMAGGAFNILNSIYTTYKYLSSHTGTVDATCLNNKIETYWKAGFNPYQYLSPSADPSYLPNTSYYNGAGDKTLNISGGRLGNTSVENTDHFDDYVIIHELGHFIEDNCGQLTSPGGTHALVSRIDPRLAWSEGWSNFLAGQVMYNSIGEINPEFAAKMTAQGLPTAWTYFSSTIGFSDSVLNINNGTGFMFDLKKAGSNPDTWQTGTYTGSYFDKVSGTSYPGEGHFREGAISRGFFKLTNGCGTTCAASPVAFETIWKSIDRITGVGKSTFTFKSSHDVLENVKSILGSSWSGDNLTKTQTEALHLFSDGSYSSGGNNKWVPYGTYLASTSATACASGNLYIEPRSDDPVLAGTNSDQRYSNQYLTLDLSLLPNVSEINITFSSQVGTATEFDLLLFKENYVFNIDYSCSSSDSNGNCLTTWQPSRTVTSDVVRYDRRPGSTITTKKIANLQSLDHTQRYLLNIRAYTPAKTFSSTTSYKYEIKDQSGNYICL
ncbi:MAG: M48 family metallopeptidase [Bdellovibrio sp.]|nr:M48 family metallopeptidase [Bdellovibrio sp.]